ncbi:MAG: septum formation initiator family protein [Pseudomonadota bacterium]
MSRSSPVKSILRSAGLPAIAIIAMGFFGYNAVLGPNGVRALKDVKAEVAQKHVELAALEKQRAVIQNRVNLLDQKRGADPDMVEELARKQLNVARPDEVIVILKKH